VQTRSGPAPTRSPRRLGRSTRTARTAGCGAPVAAVAWSPDEGGREFDSGTAPACAWGARRRRLPRCGRARGLQHGRSLRDHLPRAHHQPDKLRETSFKLAKSDVQAKVRYEDEITRICADAPEDLRPVQRVKPEE